MSVRLGPDYEHIGDWRIGDPHLGPADDVAALHLLSAGAHASGVGAGVRLGEAEAADPFAGGELGQVLLPLLLRSVGVDRVHHEARLDRHGRAVAAVDALNFTSNEAVADVAEPGAAIFGRDGGAEEPELAHLTHDLAVEALVEISRRHPRLQLLLRIAFRGVADEALLVRELMIEIERILPVERQDGWFGHCGIPAVNEVAGPLAVASRTRHPARYLPFAATLA